MDWSAGVVGIGRQLRTLDSCSTDTRGSLPHPLYFMASLCPAPVWKPVGQQQSPGIHSVKEASKGDGKTGYTDHILLACPDSWVSCMVSWLLDWSAQVVGIGLRVICRQLRTLLTWHPKLTPSPIILHGSTTTMPGTCPEACWTAADPRGPDEAGMNSWINTKHRFVWNRYFSNSSKTHCSVNKFQARADIARFRTGFGKYWPQIPDSGIRWKMSIQSCPSFTQSYNMHFYQV